MANLSVYRRIELDNPTILMKKIDCAGDARKLFEKAVQNCAIQCVLHSHVHGNVDYAKNLMKKMEGKDSGIRHKALKDYLLHFGAIMIVGKGSKSEWKLDRTKQMKGIMDIPPVMDMVLDSNWWNFKPEGETVEKVVKFESVANSIKKFGTAVSKGTKLEMESDDIDAAIAELVKLKELIAKRKALGL